MASQPALAGERVEDDDGGREKQQGVDDRAAATAAVGLRTLSAGSGSSVGVGHSARTVPTQFARKYNS
jgi:hypothetical protein